MLLWITGVASVFLICVSTVHKISDGPIFAAAIKHLNNSKSVRLGIDGIELTSGLVILACVMMLTTLTTSSAPWTALSVLVTSLHLAVGLTRAMQSFSRSFMPDGIILSTTIFFLMHAQILQKLSESPYN